MFRNPLLLSLLATSVLGGCGGLNEPRLTARGGYADSTELLRVVFRRLPSADADSLTELTLVAQQTPGISDAGRYQHPEGMMLRFEPALDADDVAFIAGWDDVFVLPGPSDEDPYVLSLFQQIRPLAGSYQQLSLSIPKSGVWTIFAEVDDPPRGPFPKWGNGATGAYPLVDYPVKVNSLTVIDKRE